MAGKDVLSSQYPVAHSDSRGVTMGRRTLFFVPTEGMLGGIVVFSAFKYIRELWGGEARLRQRARPCQKAKIRRAVCRVLAFFVFRSGKKVTAR